MLLEYIWTFSVIPHKSTRLVVCKESVKAQRKYSIKFIAPIPRRVGADDLSQKAASAFKAHFAWDNSARHVLQRMTGLPIISGVNLQQKCNFLFFMSKFAAIASSYLRNNVQKVRRTKRNLDETSSVEFCELSEGHFGCIQN